MNSDTREMVNDLLDANVPFVLSGVPGIAKSSELAAMVAARGGHFETLIASGMEPSDYGVPVKQSDGTVSFALPSWAKRCIDAVKAGKFCALFIDEASQVHPAMQAPMLELWRVGRINGDWSLPQEVRRFGAMNPTDCGGQFELSAAMANRIAWVNVSPDFDGWSDFMMSQPDPHGFIPGMLAFLKSRPQLAVNVPKDQVKQSGPYPTFRSWHNASKCRTDQSRAALVGDGAYAEYIQWRSQNDLPNPEEVCDGKAQLPTRADARYATLMAVSALGGRDYKAWGSKAWKVLVSVADQGHVDEALVPAKHLAARTTGHAPELGKLGPHIAKIMRG